MVMERPHVSRASRGGGRREGHHHGIRSQEEVLQCAQNCPAAAIRDRQRQLEFFLFGMAGGKLVERVRALSFQSIMHQEVAWFDDPSNSSGALGARLFNDALNIRRLNYIQVKFLKGFSEDAKVYFALVSQLLEFPKQVQWHQIQQKAQESTTSILAVIDRRSKIDPTSDEGIKLEKIDGNIDFNHVSFKYPSRPDVQVFNDFTLGIPSGKTTALVGESGSGKSTVIALLERFYDPDSGTISLDGIEIKNLTLSWLRDQMGLGYNTNVGERGTQLSGGQKQRVAIARAILKDPRVLLLNEATSALDAESERIVQDALDKVMVSRTTIVVAHRLSTIKGADTIAVIKDGSVAEKGKHESLMGIKGGVYASLVELHSKASAS
ncbi:hypothetical protein ZWY2020_014989 [Hordeum vulgare]|nr:hypothetical protein ZWY2020_014989 [Hordeum vulgare]